MKKDANILFKSLKEDFSSSHAFPLPGRWQDDRWLGPVKFDKKPIKPHSWGIHLAKQDYLVYWLGERNFVAEHKGASLETTDVVVAEYARLKQEVIFDSKDLIDLALKYCQVAKDTANGLDFDWTIPKTMQTSFAFSQAFLRASKKLDIDMPKQVEDLAALCAWNADLRKKDAASSLDYVYGCQAVSYASHALALLPGMAVQSHAEQLLTLKEIAHDVRQALSLGAEQHA